MLIQSSLPGPIEETWPQRPKWEKIPLDGYEEVVPVNVGNRITDDMCSLNFASSSQLSTVSTMSENSRPAFVYKRRKLQRNAVSVFQALTSANLSGGCISAIRSEASSVVGKERRMVSVLPPNERGTEVLVLNSESISGCLVGEAPGSKEALKSDIHGALDFGCVNDSYSSSKSNVELGSSPLRIEVDDTGECSSSSALVVDGVHDDRSEEEIFISIFRSQGLLEGVLPTRQHPSAGTPETRFDSSYIWTCKVCDRPETTEKMLICDLCEEAFHVSCCSPRIRKIPVDAWYCHSCSKKKHKILKEDTKSKTVNISSERSRFGNATSEGPEEELGPIASMLIATVPYEPGVRIGQDFQAEVPDWCGPSVEEVDTIGEPSEIDPSELVSLLGWNSNKPSRVSSIGNWLQCREVIEGMGEGVDGAICGKWRRAPLFEVQTDDWECFCAVHWDPAHADCAVPQELETDQVLKQLKYIEMLRPRLAAKRRKLDIRENAVITRSC